MITDPIPATDIRYNAATGCFEARVTVHGAGPARSYACEIEAPLDLAEADAEAALRAEALRRHMDHPGLFASTRSTEPVPLRSNSARALHHGLLSRLGFGQAA